MSKDPFEDIRPFHDHELELVKNRLIRDDEFIAAIARQRLGKLEPYTRWIAHPIIRFSLKPQLKKITSVSILQEKVKRYLRRLIRRTSSGLTVSGLDKLPKDQAFLFIGNHRDIVLDAALINYALFTDHRDTCRVAIGDNLLSKPYVSDLMRLNKSFIVNRSATAPREMLANFKKLSEYIQHSILVDKTPIWIAQAEGRAKDGRDKTQPAIIKMIAMSKDREQSFGDYIATLNIVPVTVSYELDPNDAAKAKELYVLDKYGKYNKRKYEDVDSIARGISGEKGKIHISFGKAIDSSVNNAEEVAQAIDRQIITQYKLHPSNYFAYHLLFGKYPRGFEKLKDQHRIRRFERKEQAFVERMKTIPEKHRDYALKMYTNIIDLKEEFKK